MSKFRDSSSVPILIGVSLGVFISLFIEWQGFTLLIIGTAGILLGAVFLGLIVVTWFSWEKQRSRSSWFFRTIQTPWYTIKSLLTKLLSRTYR